MFLFKSAPNYEGAADCFQQALIRAQTTATFTCPCIPVANLSSPAISYHKSQQAAQLLRSPAVRDIQLAVKAFEDAASAHRHAGSLGFSAAALEDAGNTLRDGKQASMAATKYLDASECHKSAGKTDQGPVWTCAWHCMDLNVSVSSALSHEDGRTGNFEKAADVLLKAGKVLAEEDPDRAVAAYLDAITIFEDEEKHIFISDAWRACLSLMLRNSKTDEAIALLLRMCSTFALLKQPEYLRKAQLSVVVLQLSQLDTVAASAALEAFGEFQMHQEGEAAYDLIQAFEAGDEDSVQRLTSTQTFTLLENQVARLAVRLKDACREAAADLTGASARNPATVAQARPRAGAETAAPSALARGTEATELAQAAASVLGAGHGDVMGTASAAPTAAADEDDMEDLL